MKSIKLLTALLALGLLFGACKKEEENADKAGFNGAKGAIVWYGEVDRAVAVDIDAVQSHRPNASGPKITSNAHSADFPGIYFIWDSKQKDNGYLKVAGWIFDKYASFTLTSKEANTFWDFFITVQPEQEMTDDGCYVFFIPRAQNNKNINMVFVSEFEENITGGFHGEPVVVNLGFIGYYLYDGIVMSTSIHWQYLNEEGDCINWVAVDAAYDDWVAQGGLEPDRSSWQTSGYASYTFEDYAEKCYGDFATGQIEGYYYAYYVDPGYVMTTSDGDDGYDFRVEVIARQLLPTSTAACQLKITGDFPFLLAPTASIQWSVVGGGFCTPGPVFERFTPSGEHDFYTFATPEFNAGGVISSGNGMIKIEIGGTTYTYSFAHPAKNVWYDVVLESIE
ncbi:MAG: hypothetical protein FWD09_04995 [Lentimicrobiaceae bacterium]|nr:hypothetical protein [Lentimicrobiaceae bacterium]